MPFPELGLHNSHSLLCMKVLSSLLVGGMDGENPGGDAEAHWNHWMKRSWILWRKATQES